ncbi:WXG100 family type VII secretion target [Paenibacillus gallinarum]|uniref:WXG100 family type VII secretion target n=1 Tax=Paenibacillus gallinarum TaxID=2762232 RepID=A0ABR8T301_9BACL|nr:WXG100 family type VII secretion target [Paenibacillus gallinarum]MBD7970147.1 WXG100 family type VII secretion target [Paenibacillus gallinarum]
MVKIMVSPDQLMEVVEHFLSQRQELERMCGQLDKQIYFIREGWSGATKERFFQEYLSARQSMGVTMEKISSIAQQLNFIARSFAEADGEGGSVIVMPSLPPKVEAKLESGVDYTASALKGVGATIVGLFDDAVGTVKSFWESPFGTVYDIGYAFTVGRVVDVLLGARFAWDYAWGTGTARSDAERLLEQIKQKEEENGRGYYTGYIASQAASYLTIGKLLKKSHAKHDNLDGSGGDTEAKNSIQYAESGGRNIPPEQFFKEEAIAEEMYEKFRSIGTEDVYAIAKNTGISTTRVQRIKEHVFINSHIKDHGVGRFEPDYELAQAWQRLIDGKQIESDIQLLQHEIFESKFEGIFHTNYRTAHDKTIESGRPWDWEKNYEE